MLPNARLSEGLSPDPSPSDAESSGFRQVFDTGLAQKPQACRKGLGGIQRGLIDGTYGNYSLIYH